MPKQNFFQGASLQLQLEKALPNHPLSPSAPLTYLWQNILHYHAIFAIAASCFQSAAAAVFYIYAPYFPLHPPVLCHLYPSIIRRCRILRCRAICSLHFSKLYDTCLHPCATSIVFHSLWYAPRCCRCSYSSACIPFLIISASMPLSTTSAHFRAFLSDKSGPENGFSP